MEFYFIQSYFNYSYDLYKKQILIDPKRNNARLELSGTDTGSFITEQICMLKLELNL